MVRLKVFQGFKTLNENNIFQFHYGTIKSISPMDVYHVS